MSEAENTAEQQSSRRMSIGVDCFKMLQDSNMCQRVGGRLMSSDGIQSREKCQVVPRSLAENAYIASYVSIIEILHMSKVMILIYIFLGIRESLPNDKTFHD